MGVGEGEGSVRKKNLNRKFEGLRVERWRREQVDRGEFKEQMGLKRRVVMGRRGGREGKVGLFCQRELGCLLQRMCY